MKFVPPLDPLAVRVISPRFLSEDERIQIADLASRGAGPTAIAAILGRAPSTISRELRRNLHSSGQYRPFHAQRQAALRRRRPRTSKLMSSTALHAFVKSKLSARWSPQQISRALTTEFPSDPTMRASTETIYLAIYRPGARLLRRPDPSPLRTGRDHRRAHTRQVRSRRRFAQPMLSV
ncbi:helix-turn-helix domain-containing protein, partial [Herbiconiux sp.]|uniref:helix-turn-helix domain-containing protein n=1 Tax=Herbiconiux sp. TaxID=1871186 RepID=UPI0025BDF6B6